MKVDDPLVSMDLSAEARLKGWAVAAAIIARLQETGTSGGIDVSAILGPAISDLTGSELEELARQLSGPLTDTSPCPLSSLAREWRSSNRGA